MTANQLLRHSLAQRPLPGYGHAVQSSSMFAWAAGPSRLELWAAWKLIRSLSLNKCATHITAILPHHPIQKLYASLQLCVSVVPKTKHLTRVFKLAMPVSWEH